MTANNFQSIPKANISLFEIMNRSSEMKIDFFKNKQKQYGHLYKMQILDRKIVVCTNPDIVKHILVDNNKNYTKSFAYDVIKIFLGNGLLTSEGEFWKRQRRLAQPAFHKQKLDLMLQNMIAETKKSIAGIEQYEDTNLFFDFNKVLYELTLNIVNKTLFYNEIKGTTDMIYNLVSKGSEFISERINNPLRLPEWIPTPQNIREKSTLESMDNVFKEIIQRRRKSKTPHEDLLSMFMDAVDEETGEGMTDKQLRDEILTIFVAGHETTQIALAWTLYLLSKNPDKMKILQQEIDENIIDDNIDSAVFRKMPYLKMVIDESMRIFPPAWIIGRKSIDEDVLLNYKIDKETNVIMPVFLIHKDPEIWENPNAFIPERFAPEKIKERHKYAYFPFGGGPRLCIGNNFAIQEMQVALCLMLKKFKIEIDKNFVPDVEPLVTLRQKNLMYAKISSRGK